MDLLPDPQEVATSEPGDGLRVVVAGKGGVGKSTLTALLARQLARSGRRVLAIDADEQRNLAATLGLDIAAAAAIIPVASQAAYVEEKTGARPGEGAGAMLRLNPDTTDIVERLSVSAPDGVRLLVMGGVGRAGGGCLCPENALLGAALAGMRLRSDEVVVMDTHAGVEHFGRALARGFNSAVIVVDPTYNAVQVGLETARLTRELGIETVHLVINRARGVGDIERVLEIVDDAGGTRFSSVCALPYDERVLETEPSVDLLLEESAISRAAAPLVVDLLTSPLATAAI
jgi:CO dehydrogenase maturation factor